MTRPAPGPRRGSLHLTNARVVTPGGVIAPGWLTVTGRRITAVGPGPAPAGPPGCARYDLDGRWVFPGFIDLHVHGGGGASFNSGDPDEIRAGLAFHRRHGTTRTLAGVVTAGPAATTAALRALAEVAAAGPGAHGHLLGAYLEGPFISAERPGCHPLPHLLPPDTGYFRQLCAAAGPGGLRMITIAPELPGALDLITAATDAGVIAAVGHTAADLATATAAFDAGSRLVTHLHNAMTGLHHRAPGVVGAALADQRVTVELIADGLHVHDDVLRLTFAAAAGRIALVTDAAPAAGTGPGSRGRIGLVPTITRADGTITTEDGATLAGSSLTMAGAVAHCLAIGIPPVAVAEAAATVPARLLGLADDLGGITRGRIADLTVLDAGGACVATVVDGDWTATGPGAPVPEMAASTVGAVS